MNPIATVELIEVLANGTRDRIRVELGKPEFDDRRSWACPVLLTTIDSKIRSIRGESSIQALCLAVEFVHYLLQSRLDRGSRLLEPDDENDFSLEACFGTRGQPGAGPNAEERDELIFNTESLGALLGIGQR